MDFSLSEEQELLQDTVRSFASQECPPQVVREVFDSETGTEPSLWKGLVEMGVAGLVIPEEYGGAGLELLECALVAEELGSAAVPVPFLGHSLAALALVQGGSPDQRAKWLPELATGDRLGTVAIAEADGAWAPDEWTLELSDGKLSGSKNLVPAGPDAGLIVVGCQGGELALVDAAGSGVSWTATDTLDRGRRLFELELSGADAEPLAAGTGARLRDAALVLLAADAFGAGHRLVRMTVEYAKTREQFGQPIGNFQAVKHQLANMALDIDPSRGLFWYAAHAFDHLKDESTRAAAQAKAHITDRAMHVARESIQIHGGIGMTWECDAQIWFKRALFDRQWMGTPEAHRARLADLGGW